MKNLYLTISILLFAFAVHAQKEKYFAAGTDHFSKKKISYITLVDGTELQGTIKKLNWKKGLFEEITLIVDDKKKKMKAEEISTMYLPQGNLDKLGKFLVKTTDATKWQESTINMDHIKEGYAYFETAEVQIKKKKTQILLLQLVNPAFCNKIKVFHDPYAGETGGIGIAGLRVTGGIDKSYWVKKGDAIAYKLKKKNYSDHSASLFEDCTEFYRKIKSSLSWKTFDEHVYKYANECN